MISIKDFNFYLKKTLVRCDFNVPIERGEVVDDFRIKRAMPTILFLKKSGAKIILISHLGRPEISNKGRGGQLSLLPVKKSLERLLREKVEFSKSLYGFQTKNKINSLEPGKVLLLENLRFEKGEETNDINFAKKLSSQADVYVNEAFSVCHREHCSVVSLPKILPSFSGIELLEEVDFLTKIRDNPKKPFTVIIGGAKLDSKMKVIGKFLETADDLLFGGDIADVILSVKGICIGRKWPEKSIVGQINKIDISNKKVHLPIDAIISPNRQGDIYLRESAPGSLRKDEEILDIGPETIEKFVEIISKSSTIFWSGPLGLVENEKFEKGTISIAKAIKNNKSAIKVLGGGDTVPILLKHNLGDSFSFISTGGGAMLSFLANEEMPGLSALNFLV